MVGVDGYLNELQEAEVITLDEAGQASAQRPSEQNIGRLSHRLVDLRLAQVEVLGESNAGHDEIADLVINLGNHGGERKGSRIGRIVHGRTCVRKILGDLGIFHRSVYLKNC